MDGEYANIKIFQIIKNLSHELTSIINTDHSPKDFIQKIEYCCKESLQHLEIIRRHLDEIERIKKGGGAGMG